LRKKARQTILSMKLNPRTGRLILKQVEKKAEDSLAPEYRGFLFEIKECIRSAQYAALKAVNVGLVSLYWGIGRMIVERQEQASWGKSVVEHLSGDLRCESPGIAGFSVQNLWYMSQFFMRNDDQERLQPLVGEIAWAENDDRPRRVTNWGSKGSPAWFAVEMPEKNQ
jgi:hypothetical protein